MHPFIQRPSLRSYRVHRDLALLILTVAVCAVPFLAQPFHMDDNFYMDMARNARVKPLYPNDVPYVFEGRQLPDMGSHSHPPLQTYFLALMQHLAGEDPGTEWIYHCVSLIYPFLAVMAFYFLCARFVERPLWPSLLLACCPLFMVMQHNLMTDVPTLAFWLAAISCFVWAMEYKSSRLFVASSFFQFAAMFTSYQSAALFPLLGFYQWRKRGGRIGWLSLLAPIAGMATWFAFNYSHYHRFLLGDTYGYLQSRHAGSAGVLGIKLVALLEYQGWLMLFPFFLICTWSRGLRGRLAAVTFLAAIYLMQMVVPQYRLTDKLVFVVGMVAGTSVLLRMVQYFVESCRGNENSIGMGAVEGQFLGLWYLGVAFYCILILTEGSARYILPLVPPFLICFFRFLEASEASEYRLVSHPIFSPAMIASGTLVFTLAWGLLLSHADLEFARIYPRAAQESSHITIGTDSFFAGEWGFRYYFSRVGAKQLPTDDSKVVGGSWIARPKLALPYNVPAALLSMTMPAQTLSYDPATPLRLLDWRTPAGFYSTGWGLLPFSMSRNALEEVEIRQVNFMVEMLPRARVECLGGVHPWPGYLEIQGKSPLGILFKPGARLLFPWTWSEPLRLELKCGIGADAYRDGLRRHFRLEIAQRDAQGRNLAYFVRDLNPGLVKEDRKWQEVQMSLLGRPEAGNLLEFSFQSDDEDASGTAAFVEAVLRRP